MALIFRMFLVAVAVGLALPAAAQADRTKMLNSIADAFVVSELCPGLEIDEAGVDRSLSKVPNATVSELRDALDPYIKTQRNLRKGQDKGLVCEVGEAVFGSVGVLRKPTR
jgi:hypothetical protein